MIKPLSIQITVPYPCTADWDKMQPDAHGRFCTQCEKTVIDCSSWSDAELYNFFAMRPANVCGRFATTQLNHPITIPYQPYSRLYRMTIALGLTLIFVQPITSRAQISVPKVAQMPDTLAGTTPKTHGDTISPVAPVMLFDPAAPYPIQTYTAGGAAIEYTNPVSIFSPTVVKPLYISRKKLKKPAVKSIRKKT